MFFQAFRFESSGEAVGLFVVQKTLHADLTCVFKVTNLAFKSQETGFDVVWDVQAYFYEAVALSYF